MSMMEPTDSLFKLFHRYNKLVRRGLTKPLTCTCGQTYVTALGKSDGLVLRCMSCGTDKQPGLMTIANVRAVVSEHFSE